MRFYSYINEQRKNDAQDLIDKTREDINKLCKPYIKNLKKYNDGKYLFSGRRRSNDVIKNQIRIDRKPKDMPLDIHNLIDRQFYQDFGFKARSQSLFCVQRYQFAKAYGVPYYIFPIGNYITIWAVRIDDLYEWLKGEISGEIVDGYRGSSIRGGDIIEHWDSVDDDGKKDIIETIKNLNIPNYYSSRDYQKLNKDTNEIMLHCKEYIGISYEFISENFYNNIWGLING